MTRNFVYATISALSTALLLLLSVVITNTLGQGPWGDFMFALSMALIGEALMDFGIHQVTIRSIARDRATATQLFRNSLAVKALPGAAMFVLLSVVTFVLHDETDIRIATVLMLGSAVFRSYILTVRGVLQGLESFRDDAIVVVVDRLLILGLCTAAVWLGYGIVGAAAGFLVARIGACAAGLMVAHGHVGLPMPAFDKAVWSDLRRRSLPLGAFLVLLNLYAYIDTILLRSLASDVETGLYNSAYKAYEGLTYGTAVISAVITPRLAHLWSVDKPAHVRLLRRALAGCGAAAIGLAIVIRGIAPYLLRIFGEDAVLAAPALNILCLGLPFVYGIWILQAAAISVFEERWLLRATLIGVAFNVALNLVLIPVYGRDGAAWATVASEILSLGMLMWALRTVLWPSK
jgi:O-antigen/teichoic acid export membrane protein